jgi:hypothetical protein
MPVMSAAGTKASQATVVLAGQFAIVGGTLSFTVIVCVQTAVLLQASVAWYVRFTSKLFAQEPAIVWSPTCVTVGAPQLSVAITEAVFTAGTAVAHTTVMSAGQVIVGTVLSSTVIVCVHSAKLPHSSVARYVRVTVFGQFWLLSTSPTCVIVIVPLQLSVAVTSPMFAGGSWPLQSTLAAGGQVTTGATSSFTVMFCAQVFELPHSSVALYVRVTVYLFAQVWLLIASPRCTTVTAPEHASVAVTKAMLGSGTNEAQVTVVAAGQVTVGAVTSFTVITCVQVAVLPQASVALYVRVIVYLLLQMKLLIASPSKVTVGIPLQLSVAVIPAVLGAGT